MSKSVGLGMSSLLLLLALAVPGCARREKPESEGRELSKNPVKALSQMSDAVKKAGEAAKEAQEMKPVDPVHFSALIPLLPEAPSGWTAEEPKGETSSGMGFKITTVNRHYASAEKSMKVAITDGAYHSMIYAGVTMASQFSQETTEGYTKGVTFDGNPGVENFRKAGGHAELTVVVAKRYLVAIEANGVTPEFVREVWGKLDRAKLAALK